MSTRHSSNKFQSRQTVYEQPYIGLHERQSRDMLRRLRVAAVDLFVQLETNGPVMLYYRAGSPIEAQQLYAWADTGVQHLFVQTGDFQCFGTHLLESVESFAEGEPVPHVERYAALQLALAMEIDNPPIHRLRTLRGSGRPGRPRAGFASYGADQVLPRDLFR